jgi:hypothetical protein
LPSTKHSCCRRHHPHMSPESTIPTSAGAPILCACYGQYRYRVRFLLPVPPGSIYDSQPARSASVMVGSLHFAGSLVKPCFKNSFWPCRAGARGLTGRLPASGARVSPALRASLRRTPPAGAVDRERPPTFASTRRQKRRSERHIVNPQQDDHERTGGSIGGRDAAAAQVQSQEKTPDRLPGKAAGARKDQMNGRADPGIPKEESRPPESCRGRECVGAATARSPPPRLILVFCSHFSYSYSHSTPRRPVHPRRLVFLRRCGVSSVREMPTAL